MTKSNIDSHNKTFAIFLLPLMALIAPFLVFPIEMVLPYPYIVEEIIKSLLIINVVKLPSKKIQIFIGICLGVFFAVSETVLYSFNFFMLTSIIPLIERLFLTSLLHALTIVVMILSNFINKKLLPLGVILAMIIHYFYNLLAL
ncbi:MAG: hypothetical protein US40_C0004G0099 [Candidatus Roizmanbacteria bacterium GW2011_GWC2_37_13]|uniref:Uncharacterized protein n=1 Tax=Candidatus Roizmanbacteria bacterium GW2011_GWC2_37_13 TaxID=1618486 RepID=A0A0G0IPF5_9BACT|nr:MAG: hypothetical protein US38_C0001G0085 [Candidatus Roizmanbacteria bacterium GW2011_GWC1_37_12]KKQ26064.1 MAG: hypothetical protein US40_C0004G0099 [Candidatus Roizmanbacteria bacterium GW2011_GWC2_37_13]